MKIISKFHDYYDGVMRQNFTKTPVYVRESKEVPCEEKYGPREISNIWGFHSQTIWLHRLGVAGKIYPVFEWNCKCKTPAEDVEVGNPEKLLEHLKVCSIEQRKHYPLFETTEQIIEKCRETIDDREIFVELGVPCFVFRCRPGPGSSRDKVEINPRLSDYNFQTVMDPWTVFQEIEMFLGNELAQEKQGDTPSGDDKVLAGSKGFNKWSFRKEPSKTGKKNEKTIS